MVFPPLKIASLTVRFKKTKQKSLLIFFLASSGLGKIILQLAGIRCINFFLRGHSDESGNLMVT